MVGHVWRLMMSIWSMASRQNIGLISAGVAFFGMFAIFPAIAAVIALFGLMADPSVVAAQLQLLQEIIPPDAYGLFEGQITALLGARTDALGWATFVSIVLALWSSRAGVSALIGGLNAIVGAPNRSGIRHFLAALTLTLTLVLLALVALTAVVIVPVVMAVLPVALSTAWILEGLRWLLALTALWLALSLLYRFGPNKRGKRAPWMTLGAVVVIFLWILASVGLSYYLSNFASYNEVYGSLGAVIGLLLWLYISAYLVLLGAVLNEQVHL